MATTIKKGLLYSAGLAVGLLIGIPFADWLRKSLFPTLEEQIARQIRTTLVDSRELPPVNAAAWKMLRLGMTKDQVAEIIPGSHIVSTEELPDGTITETWQYGHSDGLAVELARGASPSAYLVTFDSQGKVISLRAPTDKLPAAK